MIPTMVTWMVLALATAASAATAPDAINYHGVLRDSGGVPLEGSFDMTFRFFDAAAAGGEILVDEHLAAGSGAVAVSGGLFNVPLGAGNVSDGGGAFPGDPYTSLSEVFADFTDVWIEIGIGGETLSPRIQVVSAGHALNADNAERLEGLSGSQFLRSDQNSESNGSLTAAELHSKGSLFANSDGPDGDASVYFHEGTPTGRFLKWNDLLARFETNARLWVPTLDTPEITVQDHKVFGDIYFNPGSPDGPGTIYFRNNGFDTFEWIAWSDVSDRFSLSNDLRVVGTVKIEGNDLFLGRAGLEEDHNIYFRDDLSDTGEWIRWRQASDWFDISDDVNIVGEVVTWGRQITLNEAGPNFNQDIEFYNSGAQAERFQWDATSLRFEVSDDFHAFGEVSGTVKNFVQNHPYRDDLEIVYTSLEGNEVTTFTRGSGRLIDGEARIVLEESFRYVTNPELGLSVHLTPRGASSLLYVDSITTSELVVRSDGSDVAFDFIVYGLRVGFEDFPIYRPKRAEAFAPPPGQFAEVIASEPELAEHTALRRYRRMATATQGLVTDDMPAAWALREAIGMREPNVDFPPGSDIPVREMNRIALEGQAARSEPDIVEQAGVPRAVEPRTTAGVSAVARETPHDAAAPTQAAPDSTLARDAANRVPVEEDVETGDVVVIDPYGTGGMVLARQQGDTSVFGIVVDSATRKGERLVASSGIVTCKVDASLGAIRPGDLLTTSPTPGHAMRAVAPGVGSVLGKALEPLDAGSGRIRVLVTLK